MVEGRALYGARDHFYDGARGLEDADRFGSFTFDDRDVLAAQLRCAAFF